MSETSTKTLYASLNSRRRPEDIAQLILDELGNSLTTSERKTLEKAAQGSLKNKIFGYTSMLESFQEPFGMAKQLSKASELFKDVPPIISRDYLAPSKVEAYLAKLNTSISKEFGANSFKNNRLDRAARAEHGLDISRRQYNKRFRLIQRAEAKLHTLIREQKKLQFTKISKSNLASLILESEFGKDIPSACFVAYLTARYNLRSEFTIAGQQKAYDEIADMLYNKAKKSPTANWWIMAHIHPKQEVLAHLTDEQKGKLLGQWYQLLTDIGQLLQDTWHRSNMNRTAMVVRKGNDSTTWNQTAGAWNKARDGWISLIYEMGLEDLLDRICFGKCMRLIAGDVAFWHRQSGREIDPDTKVWNELPLPWEVLNGHERCNRKYIQSACKKANVDPQKSGWITPRPRNMASAYRPTPELVHGVTVDSPFLAKLLKEEGFFSGKAKQSTMPPDVTADLHKEVITRHRNEVEEQNNKPL
jgi:hypothetical protein